MNYNVKSKCTKNIVTFYLHVAKKYKHTENGTTHTPSVMTPLPSRMPATNKICMSDTNFY